MINNAFYEDLKEDWYQASDHPIALLRAENAARNPWILEVIRKEHPEAKYILDIGCGGGFLTNTLAREGYCATGVDLSASSLEVAKKRDVTHSVHYLHADAYDLPFKEASFDVICAMDFLEHVEKPEKVIKEISRLLKPGGLFFFHTFNRNWISWLVIIKGVEWCVPNSPEKMHVYPLFIKPKELRIWCQEKEIEVIKVRGLVPRFYSYAFWKSLLTKRVDNNLSFTFTSSLKTGYVGYGRKNDCRS